MSHRLRSEEKPRLPLPPKTSLATTLAKLHPVSNSYFILERKNGEYIQCGGAPERCTVEICLRNPSGGMTRHTIGTGDANITPDEIAMSEGTVTVHSDEVLALDDAILLFQHFLAGAACPPGYRLRARETWPDPQRLYYDDPEVGATYATSHPNFNALCTDGFFLSETDDVAPFGSDDGHDTLHDLEAWFRNGGSLNTPPFLDELLDQWAFGVGVDVLARTPEHITAWLDENDSHERYLAAICAAAVATALGQLKIAGNVHPDIRALALQALQVKRLMSARARTRHPDWKHAGRELAGIDRIETVLHALGKSPSTGD